ncbi:hypothetical protein Q8F55_004659 [Vanrija albida]|uniref:Uncharacterized protein n=1 Tax=Vanrija albida TaxID=181172 RepID=A0ABR3Q7C9_9TREE
MRNPRHLASTSVLDFKDWVKAGRDGGNGNGNGASGYDELLDENGLPTRYDDASGHYQSSAVPHGPPQASDVTTMAPAPRGALDSGYGTPSGQLRRGFASPSANSMSSLSIDSSRSPNGNSARQSISGSIQSAGEQLRNTLSTPLRSSRELSRETSNNSAGSRASQRFSIHSPGSPASSGIDSPLHESRQGSTNSPLERRFSRRLAGTRRTSGSGLATAAVPEGVEYSHQRQDSMASVDERIREAEEKLARRASLRAARAASEQQNSPSPTKAPFKRFSSQRSNLSNLAGQESPTGAQSPSWMESPREPPSPTRQGSWEAGDDGANGESRTYTRADSRPNGNGDARQSGDGQDKASTPTTGSRSGGKSRQPIPAEFQNDRLFTPSPEVRGSRGGLVDLNDSPRASPVRARREASFDGKAFTPYSPARAQSVLDNPRLVPRPGTSTGAASTTRFPRAASRQEFTENSPFIQHRRGDQLSRRPESVLETSHEHHRYSGGVYNSPNRLSSFDDGARSRRLSSLLNERDNAQRPMSRHSRDMSNPVMPHMRERDYGGSRDFARESPLSRDFNRDSPLSRDFNRDSPSHRDFSSKIGLTPNDSVSAVGGRSDIGSGKKDPLDLLRKIEENRSDSNRRWEEDRAASVLGTNRLSRHSDDRAPSVAGDRSSRYGEREMLTGRSSSRMDENIGRPSSRLSNSGKYPPRPTSSMSSVRDSFISHGSGARTLPMSRRRTNSGETVESPLVGRSSRASGSFTIPQSEPRVTRRSQTSIGSRSQASSDHIITEHGRNLVDAARILDRKLEAADPQFTAKLTGASTSVERANAGVKAAIAIAAELAVDVEVDDAAAVKTVRDRLPRLAVTLREAGRLSDQAVRDLTEALLNRNTDASKTSTTSTPARGLGRRPDSIHTLPKETPQSDTTRRWSHAVDSPRTTTNVTRHSPSLSTPSVHSPLGYRRVDLPARPGSNREPRSPPTSSTTSRFDNLPRVLDPIEQSPPKSARGSPAVTTSQRASPTVATYPESPRRPIGLGMMAVQTSPSRESAQGDWSDEADAPSTPGLNDLSDDDGHEEEEQRDRVSEPVRHLNKKASSTSTTTLRLSNFMPAHAPEPTTQLSSSPAYSTTAPVSDIGRYSHHSDESDRGAPSRGSIYSQRDSIASPTAAVFPTEVARTGTFGTAEGNRIRASVSERFRKHLNGD